MSRYFLGALLLAPTLLYAQTNLPADLARERADRAQWLAHDPLSPARAAALAMVPPSGVTLGPDGSDVVISGAPLATVREARGQLTLTGWGAEHTLAQGRATPLRGVRLIPLGTTGRMQLAVYRDDKPGKRPTYYPYAASARQSVTLTPITPKPQRILAPDGTTVEATEVGTVSATLGATTVALRVMRVRESEEESRLLINFRDATNDAGSYPAGRFVELIPLNGQRYTLDLNRAFNPYCAYSSVFPCPIPWAGNLFEGKVEAGERYPAEVVAR